MRTLIQGEEGGGGGAEVGPGIRELEQNGEDLSSLGESKGCRG